jgi:hypothetical protein
VNPKLKSFAIISLKQAVNALLVTFSASQFAPSTFSYTNWHGFLNILKLAGSVVAAREAQIWVPWLLKWSSTAATPEDANGAAAGK